MREDVVKNLIMDYERDILGNRYHFFLSDGVELSFGIEEKHVPHLMGIRKLPIRQAQNKSAPAIYEMLKDGTIDINHIALHKEAYKKVMNFRHIISILHCGDAVKVVKRVGSLNSSYLLYLDHQPDEIIHLGIARDDKGWYPESLLVMQRNVTKYIDNQMPLDILKMEVVHQAEC